MKKVVLIFPDSHSMADFITEQNLVNAEANSFEHTLVTTINDDQISMAETIYKAFLKAIIPKN